MQRCGGAQRSERSKLIEGMLSHQRLKLPDRARAPSFLQQLAQPLAEQETPGPVQLGDSVAEALLVAILNGQMAATPLEKKKVLQHMQVAGTSGGNQGDENGQAEVHGSTGRTACGSGPTETQGSGGGRVSGGPTQKGEGMCGKASGRGVKGSRKHMAGRNGNRGGEAAKKAKLQADQEFSGSGGKRTLQVKKNGGGRQ